MGKIERLTKAGWIGGVSHRAGTGVWSRAWTTLGIGGGLFLGLSVVLRLPDVLAGHVPVDPVRYLDHPARLYYLFSLDLFALVSLLALVPYSNGRSRIRAVVVGSLLFLLAYRTYDAVVVTMLHRSPIFYADASHVVGAAYLLVNAAVSWTTLGTIGAGLGGVGLLAWGLPAVIRRLHRCVTTPIGRRGVLVANVVVWPLVVFAILAHRGSFLKRATYQSVCLSTTECLVRNVQASGTLRREVTARATATPDSTYAGYWALEWERPPSLYLVMIESYGSILSAPGSPVPYDRFMERTADSLRASGWHGASAQSEAPVFGGLSWLSVATLFLGTPVEHQPVFETLRPTLSRAPHLVRLLRRQGYETATLQPPVRTRPGLPVGNPYGFDRTFYLRDLDYQGPKVGWGIVPDQYSLSVAHERFVKMTETPFFLFFETVTPHAPWHAPPPRIIPNPEAGFGDGSLEGWMYGRILPTSSGSRPEQAVHTSALPYPNGACGVRITGSSSLIRRASAAPASMVPADGAGGPSWAGLSQTQRLFRHVQYDWRVLTKYLRAQAPPNSLVVVMGDHQPYFAETESPATPIHVLSQDRDLLRRFHAYGFVPGLHPSPDANTLHHAGLYSLLVRVLTAHDRAAAGEASTARPPYRPRGVERAALLPRRP